MRRATDPPRHPHKLCSLQDTILLYEDPCRSRDDVVEAVAILKSATKASKRTFGEAHPVFRLLKNRLLKARHERAFLDLEARYGEGSLKH